MSRPAFPSVPREAEQYLAEIEARLPGSRRARAGIIAELRSGLLDAMDAYTAAAYTRGEAVAAGIREFGDPARVASGFRAEIAASQARRTALMLLVTGPLVGALWITTALGIHLSWARLVPVGVAVLVTAYGAIAAIAATGQLTRWLPDEPRRAPMAAAIAGFGAIGVEGLSLALVLAVPAVASVRLSPALGAAAVVASLARLALAARGTHRCLATRAALGRPVSAGMPAPRI